ncbi:hypothetical protein EUA67_03620, partial [TM7 phylum sp. oral taxon 352]
FDGKIRTVVREIVSPTAIRVEVQNDGFLMSRKGLNLPDTDFGGDILTHKDINDLEWGCELDHQLPNQYLPNKNQVLSSAELAYQPHQPSNPSRPKTSMAYYSQSDQIASESWHN